MVCHHHKLINSRYSFSSICVESGKWMYLWNIQLLVNFLGQLLTGKSKWRFIIDIDWDIQIYKYVHSIMSCLNRSENSQNNPNQSWMHFNLYSELKSYHLEDPTIRSPESLPCTIVVENRNYPASWVVLYFTWWQVEDVSTWRNVMPKPIH